MICVKRKVVSSNLRKKGRRQVVSQQPALRLATAGDRTPNLQGPVTARSGESQQKKEKKMLNESKKNRR